MTALDLYRDALAATGGDVDEFPITNLDRTGVPVWTASLFDPSGAYVGAGVGYGHTDDAARTSAMGEAVEGLGTAAALPALQRVRATFRELGAGRAVDPVALCLPAGTEGAHERELEWVGARRWPSGEEVLVPLEAVAEAPKQLPDGYDPLFVPITNGLGAGESVERAVVHGILEAVQRDGNSVAYRALDRGVLVDLAGLSDEVSLDVLHALDSAGVDVQVKAAYDDLGMANVYVVGADREPALAPHPLCVTACGEAAHPDRERAIRKALLEFCSSRARKPFNHGPLEAFAPWAPERYLRHARGMGEDGQERRALDAILDWLDRDADDLRRVIDPLLAVRRTVALGDLPHTDAGDDPAAVLDVVVERLAEAGLEALWIDLTPPGQDAVRIAKALVPGLEVETMSYGRIGERNLARLLRDRPELELVGLGAPPAATARPIVRPEGLEPAWLDPAAIERVVGTLYALYREPDRHVAANLVAA